MEHILNTLKKIEIRSKSKSLSPQPQPQTVNNLERDKALQLTKQPIEITRYRNERNLMLYPFCSVSKRKRLKTIDYKSSDGKRWLKVSANYEKGMVKIWDFDILRFALSKAGEVKFITEHFPEYVDFTAYECLKSLGKKIGSTQYEWIVEALGRLGSTFYNGNIFRESEKEIDGFTIMSYRFIKDENDKIEHIRIIFNSHLIESVRNNSGLLSIDPSVIVEKSGIKKRLLELVKTSIGKSNEWTVGLDRLHKMCASEDVLKDFKRRIKGFDLPWEVVFSKTRSGKGENLTFKIKNN